MKTSKPISLTVQTQTLTTEEGSQSIETSAYMRNSTSIYKPLNTMPNKSTHFNSSLKFQNYPSLLNNSTFHKTYTSNLTISTNRNPNNNSIRVFKPRPILNSILTNNYLRTRAVMRPESSIPISTPSLEIKNIYYNTDEKETLYSFRDVMKYFSSKTCANFNNRYNFEVRMPSNKKRKKLLECFSNIRKDTSPEVSITELMKLKGKSNQLKHNIDNDKMFMKGREGFCPKLRPLSQKKVSIKLIKMLQNKK